MSRIWLLVFRISPTKMDACWAMSVQPKAMPKTMA
jgi:hypothetical protein